MTNSPLSTSTTTTTTVTTTVPLVQQAYLLEKDNETGVKHQGPRFKGEIRVPSAQGLALISLIAQVNARRSRLERGWVKPPSVSVNAPRQIVFGQGSCILPSYPGVYKIEKPWAFDLPALESAGGMIRRSDYVYIVSLVAHVGADIDPGLVVTFAYRPNESEDIKVDQKENELRYRVFTGIVVSSSELTPDMFYNSLIPLENVVGQPVVVNGQTMNVQMYERNTLTIQNKTSKGFSVGNFRFYALDDNWKEGATYAVEPKLIDLVSAVRVKRVQNVADNGIVVGQGGEEALTQEFNVIPYWERHETLSSEAVLHRRLITELFAGKPGKGGSYERAVINLASGPVGINPGKPGIPASTPNGSVSLATGQRISVSNQACRQDSLGAMVTAGNDGSGNPELVFTLASNLPQGTKFSALASSHKVYALDSTEISSLGTFRNLGGSGGPIIWVGNQNARNYVNPGQKAYFLPAIDFPSGSGSSIPFTSVTRIWLNGTPIDPRNVRVSYLNDPQAYELPANGEQYIVTVGPERSAIPHYILRHVVIRTTDKGILITPEGMGALAFVENVTYSNKVARLDRPLVSGLKPNTDYRCLVYKPPLPGEAWQFELLYPSYEGVGQSDPDFLNGATVASLPCAFAHTQGSGSSVFKGEGELMHSPIATRLPIGSDPIQHFQLDAPIQWQGEGNVGDITFRQMPIIPGAGLSLPIPGQQLVWQRTANSIPVRSLQGILKTQSGYPIGFRTPKIATDQPYQAVFAFLVEKNGIKRLVCITQNTPGDENVSVSSDTGAGIDLFEV